jgi:hypothetical protein
MWVPDLTPIPKGYGMVTVGDAAFIPQSAGRLHWGFSSRKSIFDGGMLDE